MKTSVLVDGLRTVGVVNTHHLLLRFAEGGKDVACEFSGNSSGSVRSTGTRVYSPSHPTDPKAHWLDHGQKTFAGSLARSMPLAIAWTSEKYGITKWITSPLGRTVKIPLVVKQRAIAAVQRALKVPA